MAVILIQNQVAECPHGSLVWKKTSMRNPHIVPVRDVILGLLDG